MQHAFKGLLKIVILLRAHPVEAFGLTTHLINSCHSPKPHSNSPLHQVWSVINRVSAKKNEFCYISAIAHMNFLGFCFFDAICSVDLLQVAENSDDFLTLGEDWRMVTISYFTFTRPKMSIRPSQPFSDDIASFIMDRSKSLFLSHADHEKWRSRKKTLKMSKSLVIFRVFFFSNVKDC